MKEKKVDKRKAQGVETKKKLYEIAKKLFTQRNFADVSVEEITDEAGITKGAFYVHFESKDALIALLIADYAAQADSNYRAFVEAMPENLPTSDVLLSLSQKIADELTNTIGCENMKKVYQMMLSGAIETEAVKGYGRELYTLFFHILEKGIARKEIASSLSAETLSQHFVMALRGISYEWCVRYPDFDLADQAIEHIRLLIAGIQAHNGV